MTSLCAVQQHICQQVNKETLDISSAKDKEYYIKFVQVLSLWVKLTSEKDSFCMVSPVSKSQIALGMLISGGVRHMQDLMVASHSAPPGITKRGTTLKHLTKHGTTVHM